MRDILKRDQPIAYRILQRALQSGRISHAYLFTGPEEAKKKDAALLFAQSLVCGHTEDGFACETCDTCVRMERGLFADLIVLDGRERAIRKEDIIRIMDRFSATALETFGRKLYIIDGFETATVQAMNALLKFIEEPQGDVTAILCSAHPERILPTIVSRCQNVPFRSLPKDALYRQALDAKMDVMHAHIISGYARSFEDMQTIVETPTYQDGSGLWIAYVDHCFNGGYEALYFMQTDGLKSLGKEKGQTREALQWFLRAGMTFCEDIRHCSVISDPTWMRLLDAWRTAALPADAMTRILCDTQDRLSQNANAAMAVDEMGYQWIKEVEP